MKKILEMIQIPSGSFLMGSSDGYDYERPQHWVTVAHFAMGQFPVTQAQWSAVAALPKIDRDLYPDPSRFKGDDLPVEQVTWDDVVEFCARMSAYTERNYSLPSEAQWEYACRAGTTTPFYFGKTLTTELANYDGAYTYSEYRGKTTPVDSFPPNGFGLYDMHGNVWEWCQDNWHDNYDGAPTDGKAWLSTDDNAPRLLRGGSWGTNPYNCRSALRYWGYWGAHAFRYDNIGFRVVCE